MEEAGREGEAGEFARLDCGGSLRPLASVRGGRLIFTVRALPAMRRVTFAVAGGLIVVRAASGCAVARKVHGMIVAFEADELDNATCSGWSVTVVGRAVLVTDPGTAARYRAVPLVRWAPGARGRFVTVVAELAEGCGVRRPGG